MRSSAEHRWTKSDDMVAFYLSRHGDSLLGFQLTEIAQRVGVKPGTMRMRMSNFRSLEPDVEPGELNKPSMQTRTVFQEYSHMTEAELRPVILDILDDAFGAG
jgi:hypothetical protein